MESDQSTIIVCNVSEEGRGGGQLYCILMMAKEGLPEVKTTLVLPTTSTHFLKKAKAAKIPVYTTSLRPITKKILPLLQFLLSFWKEVSELKNLFRKINPDFVQANGSWQYKALIAASQLNIPTVWHLNDTYQPKPVLWLARRFSKYASMITYASHASKVYYEGKNPSLISLPNAIIQAPVELSRFSTKALTTLHNPIKVVTTGYININKGFEYVLEVAMQLGEDYEFHIVGPVIDSQKDYYQSLLDRQSKLQLENVVWHGLIDDVPKLLSSMDIYLCASIRESSPMAVWEALGAGLPVVSADVGDVGLIFEKYDCGYLVPIKDVAAMVTGIRNLTEDKSVRERLQAIGPTVVKKEFDSKTTTNQYLSFLQTQIS